VALQTVRHQARLSPFEVNRTWCGVSFADLADMRVHTWLAMLPVVVLMYASDMPLIVGQPVPGTPGHVQITNTGRQAVTAWSLATTTHTDGRTHREVFTADGYLSEATHGLAGSSEQLERLLPGQSREFQLDPLPTGATVDVLAVVLDDATAAGDEQVIASIFARRVKERDALRAVVEAFGDVLPRARGVAALQALQDRFTAIVQREESIPCRAALDAVQTYAHRDNPDEIDRSLRTYAAFVTREYELAVKHSQRKTS
jgi:hypothetical protein